MPDTKISFGVDDKVTPQLARMRMAMRALAMESREVGRDISNVGKFAGKIGGFGGVAGKLIGGFGGGLGLGLAGASAMGIGLAYQGISAASDRAVQLATTRMQESQKIAAISVNAKQSLANTAAGGASYAASMRKFLTRGGNVAHIRDLATQGVSGDVGDLIAGETELQNLPPELQAIVRKKASALARTGEIDYAGAVNRLASYGSGARNLDLASEYLSIRGGGTRDDALRALNPSSSALRQIDNTISNQSTVQRNQIDSLLSGATTLAVRDANTATLNPESAALDKMAEEAGKTAELMRAAADAQFGLVAVMREFGSLLGGDTSERQKYHGFLNNSSGLR